MKNVLDLATSLLTETDADVIKYVSPILVIGGLIVYAIKKDKVKDFTELVVETKGLVETTQSGIIDTAIDALKKSSKKKKEEK
jgi:hypothetical protein|nr:MAG TPA: hypothetical protein [Caudoviricetes sp.]